MRHYIFFLFILGTVHSQCILRFKDDDFKKKLLNKLQSISLTKYSTEEPGKDNKDQFIKYELMLCNCPNEDVKQHNASIIQYEYTNNKWSFTKVIGKHTEMDIDGGNNWYSVTYYDGDKYSEICTNMGRKGKVEIVCDQTVKKPTFDFLYEYKHAALSPPGPNQPNGSRPSSVPHCGYVFQLRLWDPDICSGTVAPPANSDKGSEGRGRSKGTILCILFFTFFGGYLLIGTAYKRFVLGAFGIEQIPNLNTWRTFLELQADGCDYVFRQNPIVRGEGQRRNNYSSLGDNYESRTSSAYKDLGDVAPQHIISGTTSNADDNLLR